MKKLLILDRDGTIILEPEDFQIDSLEKLKFYPQVFRFLYQIQVEMNYEFVMVTNQDGLGTDSFPEETFHPAHQKMLKTFENEGITFSNILIDKTFESENAPTRKPRTGLLTKYIDNPAYDLKNSVVVGDRLTDIQLAQNLGAKGILISSQELGLEEKEKLESTLILQTESWEKIYRFLQKQNGRQAKIQRKTLETSIEIFLNLDEKKAPNIQTGIGFFNHMLEQLGHHAQIELQIQARGDLHIDEHHTVEDVAIALGQAFREALGSKKGIERYGFYNLVMDEAKAEVALDFSGRSYLVWKNQFNRERVGEMPTEMVKHFFHSFAEHAACTLHVDCVGENDHHKIEAIFKGFARAVKMAIQVTHEAIPSTKGTI